MLSANYRSRTIKRARLQIRHSLFTRKSSGKMFTRVNVLKLLRQKNVPVCQNRYCHAISVLSEPAPGAQTKQRGALIKSVKQLRTFKGKPLTPKNY